MAGGANGPRADFDAASVACAEQVPGKTLLRSTDFGWTSIFLAFCRCSPGDSEIETGCTRDDRLIVITSGEFEVGAEAAWGWRTMGLQPGSALLIGAGCRRRLRWHGPRTRRHGEIVQLYVPRGLAADARRRPSPLGDDEDVPLPPKPLLHDPMISTTAVAILAAMRRGSPESYAEAGGRWLATHLASVRQRLAEPDPPRHPLMVADGNIARAIAFIGENLGGDLKLDLLARHAGLSKFHFVRRFGAATGMTPSSYLQDLRLDLGRRMLVGTDEHVGRIADACGYRRASHFATAFAKRYGEPPTAFRRSARGASV